MTTNLKHLLAKLFDELGISPPQQDVQKRYVLEMNSEYPLHFSSFQEGFFLHTIVAPCPQEKKEEIFIHLMRANFLGQGTKEARLGIDADEKFLTLSIHFAYELNYLVFKEIVENFANCAIYWREELVSLGK